MHHRKQETLRQTKKTRALSDPRELVLMPDPMRDRMLADMRDQPATLMFADIADDRVDDAGKLLGERLGMSSLSFDNVSDWHRIFRSRCRMPEPASITPRAGSQFLSRMPWSPEASTPCARPVSPAHRR
jgi:hypothetical protein